MWHWENILDPPDLSIGRKHIPHIQFLYLETRILEEKLELELRLSGFSPDVKTFPQNSMTGRG